MTTTPRESNAYSIFILVLTVFALAIMVLLLLPLDEATDTALLFYDNLICVVFLVDFAVNLSNSHPKRDYFITRRGWLDLLGSIPAFGFFPAAGSAPPCTHQPAAARDAACSVGAIGRP